jgi:hypothetical protein
MLTSLISGIGFFYFYKFVYQRLLDRLLPEDEQDLTPKAGVQS